MENNFACTKKKKTIIMRLTKMERYLFAGQSLLDFGERFVFGFWYNDHDEQGAQQAKRAERQKTTGLTEPIDQLVGHVRHHENQRPVGAGSQTRAE